MLISLKGEELYFQDINMEINKKVNKQIRANFVIANQTYNKDLLEGHVPGGLWNSKFHSTSCRYQL